MQPWYIFSINADLNYYDEYCGISQEEYTYTPSGSVITQSKFYRNGTEILPLGETTINFDSEFINDNYSLNRISYDSNGVLAPIKIIDKTKYGFTVFNDNKDGLTLEYYAALI